MRVSQAMAALVLASFVAIPRLGFAGGPPGDGAPQYDHIFVIVEENEESLAILGNPNAPEINQLAQAYGLATRYFGVIHPSEGNYVAMTGANSYGITDDAPYTTNQSSNPSIVDQLEGAGLTWKGYFQSLPFPGFTGTCFPSSAVCLYASKHNGFVNFTHVSGSPSEMANLVPDEQLAVDLLAGTVPNYSVIVPDQCNDMHGLSTCSDNQANIATGDAYVKIVVEEIMGSSLWRQGRNAIVVTFDEGSTNTGCCDANPGGGQVVTIVVTNQSLGAIQDATPYNHYSLVSSIEQTFGLGCLQFTCDTANVKPMSRLFGFPTDLSSAAPAQEAASRPRPPLDRAGDLGLRWREHEH